MWPKIMITKNLKIPTFDYMTIKISGQRRKNINTTKTQVNRDRYW